MPITPLTEPSWLFVPPLELRLENGRSGALRLQAMVAAAAVLDVPVIPADDPRNPTGHDVPFINRIRATPPPRTGMHARRLADQLPEAGV